MNESVFLTRDGSVNTPDMMTNMDDALSALSLPHDMQVVNIGTLPSTDVRTGYSTPTVLYRGVDLFGMPAPQPPYEVASGRIYKGGVPSTSAIEGRLRDVLGFRKA